MICLFGFFYQFHVLETDEISHDINFYWVKTERLGGHKIAHQVANWDESITLRGTLIVKNTRRLFLFEEVAKLKQPIRFTLPTGESHMVIITRLSKTKSTFLKSGLYVKQGYSIEMERYWE